jgi:uncharacterized protein
MSKAPAHPLVYKAKSALHGNGLFAQVPIKKGQKIIQYIGKPVSSEESVRITDRRYKSAEAKNRAYAFIYQISKDYCIDGNVPGNLAKYINHSCDPNCESYTYRREVWIRSLRAIRPGEELTFDYGFDPIEGMASPCSCGAKGCIGYVMAKAYRAYFKKHIKPLMESS